MKRGPRVHLCSRQYRFGILAPPPHHHRRDGRNDASADRGQRCRLAVGCLQRLVKADQTAKAGQIAKARHFAQASHFDEACRLAEAPQRKAGRPGAGPLEPCRFETGRPPVRSLEVPDRSGRGPYRQLEGAISARNVSEFVFNLRLARRIEEKLKAEGFAETKLLLTDGKARRSLVKRVAAANDLQANLFLSIHHHSVPNKLLEDWEFEGKKSRFSDRFSGYSVFVSRNNPDFKTSLSFAELIGREMKAQGLDYAEQYTQAIVGRYQRPLLNKETGVYSYDELIVLRKTRMAAVLLEAGSIINRDEELKMNSPERRDIISSGVAAAVKGFCEPRWAMLGPL